MIDATGQEMERPVPLRAVVLVEGLSDRVALEAAASRHGRSLSAEGVSVVDMGGATNVGRFLERFGPPGLDVSLAGLYDSGEEPGFRRALEAVGLGSDLSRADMERLGFFACVEDLEDELIRAAGADAVLDVVRTRGELGPFRTLSKQPGWRERPVEQRLKRFLGNSNRKIDYAPPIIDLLAPSAVPRPLDGVLSHI
ncbi:MAG TPA: ATP-dependent endonuclease [Actinomycetota bacterium]|nr:ATP-dependent endonuclease [Actinomycetota bacterium]